MHFSWLTKPIKSHFSILLRKFWIFWFSKFSDFIWKVVLHYSCLTKHISSYFPFFRCFIWKFVWNYSRLAKPLNSGSPIFPTSSEKYFWIIHAWLYPFIPFYRFSDFSDFIWKLFLHYSCLGKPVNSYFPISSILVEKYFWIIQAWLSPLIHTLWFFWFCPKVFLHYEFLAKPE